METTEILIALGALVAGGGVGFFVRRGQIQKENLITEEDNKKRLAETNNKAKELIVEARAEALKFQEEAKKEETVKRKEVAKIEERLLQKEQGLDKKVENAEQTKESLEKKVEQVKLVKEEVIKLRDSQSEQLSKISQLSQEEAKELLLKNVEQDAKKEIIETIKRAEQDVRDEADAKARTILAEAIQRYAAETAMESTATLVALPNDDMKGRIIGREGRNINTFEQVTGIDVIVDDTPGSIVISGFDLIRRYVAKVALEKLVADGRIHPARIEEVVEKTKKEVNVLIKELGEKAVYDTGVAGLHINLVKLLGRLKFRTSYGQNVLKHSMEVAFLAASLASEVGADVNVCKKAGLLHDIGKAVDHEIQGHHAAIGRDILKKFGLSEKVIHAVEAHHGQVEAKTIEAALVQAANAISITRPGASKDTLDNYIKRLDELENMVNSFEGVKKTYAIQAGREVRVIVDPEKLDDLQSIKLAHAVAQKIEKDLQYPGQIKVDVVRETRTEEFAT